MLGFLEVYGPAMIAGIIGAGGLAGAIYNIAKCVKLGKKVDTTAISLEKNMEITREGIVQAFKSAKLPNEIKLSITTKVEVVLSQARDMLIEEVKKNEALRTSMMAMILRVLSFTAASNKLSDDEKKQIEDMLKLMSEDNNTINI